MMISGLGGMNRAAGAQQTQGAEPRLVRAAHEFEAQMMKELLKPMSRASPEDPDGEQMGILGEFASESLAGALSAGGGLGIASRIIQTLSRSGNPSPVSAVIRNEEESTGITGGK